MAEKTKYLPANCPECNGDDFEYGDIANHGEMGLYQDITCTKCDTLFREFFIVDSWCKVTGFNRPT